MLLIFDEVVNGFRVSPGGAQEDYGIRPDLTTLAKILAGGLPGGAVTGRKDILDLLDFQVTKGAGKEKIAHPGTFNANPLSAAAGIAPPEDRRARPTPAPAPTATATTLRQRLNEVFEEEHVPWAAYGTFSNVRHSSPTPSAPRSRRPASTRCGIRRERCQGRPQGRCRAQNAARR